MDLFPPDTAANLLPHDGVVHYHPSVFAEDESSP